MNIKKKGQSLVELLLVISLLAILLPGLFTGFYSSREGKAQQNQRLTAVGFLKESEEAVRNIRETGWTTLSSYATDTPYHATVSGSLWTLVAGSETLSNGFKRQVIIKNMYRNPAGNIVLSPTPGVLDPSTKEINTSVWWNTPKVSTVSSTMYLTRHENLSYIQTTQADFDSGVKTNTATSNDSGGEVKLGAGGGGGDWCIPSLSVTTANLSRQGVPTAISAIQGSVVTGTGGNASGPTFAQISVAGNNPPTTTITGTFNNNKANGVFRDTQHFGYIATTDHHEEIKILDLNQFSDPPTNSQFKEVGYFDAPGNTDGQSVTVYGNVGYMTTTNKKFYTFDLSDKTGSRSRLGSYDLTLSDVGNKVVITANGGSTYAFVAINSTTTQMQVINVTDPSNPSIVKQVQTNNSQPGIDVSVNATGTEAYLVTSYAAGNKDFFVINASNLSGSGNLPISKTFDTGGMNPKGVAVATGNRAVIVGTGGSKQYLVLQLDQNPLITCGTGLAINNGAYAVSTVLQDDGYAYSYVVTGDTNAELKIILGGAGGQYTSSGTFESSIFNNQASTAFNSFSATINQLAQTTIKIKVAVANPVAGSCTGAQFTYVGPLGDPNNANDYFTVISDPTTIQGIIPYTVSGSYVNPGQCFRYKVWFQSSESTATPVLYDFTANYSP